MSWKIAVYKSEDEKEKTWLLEVKDEEFLNKFSYRVCKNGWTVSNSNNDPVVRERDKVVFIKSTPAWFHASDDVAMQVEEAIKESHSTLSSSSSSLFGRLLKKKKKKTDTLLTEREEDSPSYVLPVSSPWTPFTIEVQRGLRNFLDSRQFEGIRFSFSWAKYFYSVDLGPSFFRGQCCESSSVAPFICYAPFEFIERLNKALAVAERTRKELQEEEYRQTPQYKIKQLGQPVIVLDASSSSTPSQPQHTKQTKQE